MPDCLNKAAVAGMVACYTIHTMAYKAMPSTAQSTIITAVDIVTVYLKTV